MLCFAIFLGLFFNFVSSACGVPFCVIFMNAEKSVPHFVVVVVGWRRRKGPSLHVHLMHRRAVKIGNEAKSGANDRLEAELLFAAALSSSSNSKSTKASFPNEPSSS